MSDRGLAVLAAWSELSKLGSATCVGIAAALAQLTHRHHRPTSTVVGIDPDPKEIDCDGEVFRPEPAGNARLHRVLQALRDRQIIVVSNRQPYSHERSADGCVVMRTAASGLLTALEPIVRAASGVWIGHGSGSADRLTTDPNDHIRIGTGRSSYTLRRVWLTTEEETGYYYGFSNEGLWPLCHLAFASPVFRRNDWIEYERVNRRFADAVAKEITSPRPIVLVQDYHFALVPRLLRDRCPDATTLTFWHIPWPHADQFAVCPYAKDLLEGLLGSDVLAFQTARHCRNFRESMTRTLRTVTDLDGGRVVHRNHASRVRSCPISVEWPSRWAAQVPPVRECQRSVRAQFRILPGTPLIVSVDRLDYTKGFDERLTAIERLFESGIVAGQKPAFLQIAAPTRVSIDRYGELAARIRQRIDSINQKYGSESFTPVTYVERYTEPIDVFRCYRAADVCYVGSLDDGMNLVAKEFVVARDDERGSLILSRFAGAAEEMTGALLVNPYDTDGVVDALVTALDMPVVQQRARMRRMRTWIAEHNVYDWAADLLADAAGPQEGLRSCGSISQSRPLLSSA